MSFIGALLVMTALFWLVAITFVFLRQTFFIVPRTKDELIELNGRRADRVREALAMGESVAPPESESVTVYPFSGWLDLEADGAIVVGGESLSLQEEFQVEATDRNAVSRVSVESRGGQIFISSHGQFFVARFIAGAWEVLEVPRKE